MVKVGAQAGKLNTATPAPTAQSDVAEQFVHDAVRDSAMLAVGSLNRTSLRRTPIAISTYALAYDATRKRDVLRSLGGRVIFGADGASLSFLGSAAA